MDDSQDSSMDVSLSPQRAAGTGPSYGAKYNEDYGSPQSPLSASVANANESWNEDEAGDLIMVGDGGSEERVPREGDRRERHVRHAAARVDQVLEIC